MNGLQRYMNTVRGQAVDFPARAPIAMRWAAEYIGSNYGAFASDYRILVEANLRCAADFGFDQVSTISDPYREVAGFGGEIEFITDGVPRCATPPLSATKDLSTLAEPDPLTSPRMLDRVNAVRAFREAVGGELSILGWVEGPIAEAADLRGVGAFLMDLMDDEPFAEALMDRSGEVAAAFAIAQVEAGADTIGVGDAIASQVSPGIYERLVQPRQKQLVDAIHAAGALVRLHICGDITHLLPGIADLGVDILDVDHMVDMAAARQAVGPAVTLAGNIDPVAGIRFGDPDSIRQTMRQTFATVGEPYIVNAGCEIPAGTPPTNVKALCEPLRD